MLNDALLDGRFRLLEEVARGGMGRVLRAEDSSTGDSVAIKLMTTTRPEAAERFQREAELLASLEHPAIVGYVAHGETSTGQLWLAMQWLRGSPLSERLRESALSLEDCVALLTRVASALAAAHAAGVVHRDIKPSNLMLVDGRPDSVVVLDFGIARLESGVDEVTATGEVVGSWAYMSPEQAMAQATLDARSDLFSLGCVAFECLSGRKAFNARQQTGILAKILLEDPPPPSTLNAAIPAALDDLTLRLLSKSPGSRPQSAAQVLNELQGLQNVADLPVRPRSVPPTGITGSERRLLSVVLARGVRDPDATIASNETSEHTRSVAMVAEIHGAGVHFLANGVLVLTLSGRGAPRDHAARAAQTALALQAREPRAMLAVSTGFGVLGSTLPVGSVIDRGVDALRHAAAGDIVVDATTRDLIAPDYTGMRRGDAFLLQGRRNDSELSRRVLSHAVPFVGRRQELAALSALIEQVLDEGCCRVALATGPAGSGKSRLLSEVLGAVEAKQLDVRVIRSRCEAFEFGAALAPVRRLLASALRSDESDAPAVRTALLERELRALGADGALNEDSHAFLAHLLGVEWRKDPRFVAAQRDARLMAEGQRRGVQGVLTALTSRQPVLLAIEDLHWLDGASVALLEHVLARMTDAPLALLGTARPELHTMHPGAFEQRSPLEVRLAPLSNKASQRIVRAVLGRDAAATLLADIVTRAQGNPFFLEELIRAASEGRQELPDTLLAMVQSRLDSLGTHHKRLLRAGSIFGERFRLEEAAALLGLDASRLPLDDLVAELTRKEILEPEQHGSALAFRHALLRDAAYAMLTEADRQLGHRLAAEWLAGAEPSEPFVIAEHFRKGGKPARAVPYYRASAAAALAAGTPERAVELADLALTCGDDGGELGALRSLEAEAQRMLARPELAGVAAEAALSQSSPQDAHYFVALRELALSSTQLGDYVAARSAADTLKRSGGSPELAPTRAVAVLRIATAMLEGIDVDEVDEWLEAELPTIAQLAHDDAQVRAWHHVYRSLSAHTRNDVATYVDETRCAHDALNELGDERSAAVFGMNLGFGLTKIGEGAQALEVLSAAREDAQRLGLLRTEVQVDTNLSYALLCMGNARASRDAALRAIDGAERLQVPTLGAVSHAYAALAALNLGDVDGALAHAHSAVTNARAQDALVPMTKAVLARAWLARGDVASALTEARSAAELVRSATTPVEDEVWTELAHTEAEQAAGNTAVARELATAAAEKLQRVAERLPATRQRQAFLELPMHRELIQLTARLAR
ncbi:MAG: protein kinase [Polyangiaceae bacterium]